MNPSIRAGQTGWIFAVFLLLASIGHADDASNNISISNSLSGNRDANTVLTSAESPTAAGLPDLHLASLSSEIVMRALSLIDAPYHAGGNDPVTGFDCSGLVRFVFAAANVLNLPRSSDEMYRSDAPAIANTNLRAGDLLFFRIGRSARINHVGIYVGDGRFVHAPATGGRVRLDRMSDHYWQRYFEGAKRVLD